MPVQAALEESTKVRTTQAPPTRAGYYPWFDWLRLLLACVVLFGHEGLIGWRNAGNFAVQVFFCLERMAHWRSARRSAAERVAAVLF
jgi:peptidoglycan/LPS O-acetylase OafA/YrhL